VVGASSYLQGLADSAKFIFLKNTEKDQTVYSEFFLRLAIGFYMQIFQPPVNFCSDKNIQTIFGTKLEDFLNYRIDYNLISQTVEKVVKNSYFYIKCAKRVFFVHEKVFYAETKVEAV
jgi:hypothetical protein